MMNACIGCVGSWYLYGSARAGILSVQGVPLGLPTSRVFRSCVWLNDERNGKTRSKWLHAREVT